MRSRLRMGDFFSAAFRSSRIPDDDWEEAAASLGLAMDRTLAGSDAVFGSRGDIDVAIGRMTSGDRLITRYRMQFAGLPFGLQMLHRNQEPVFDVRESLPVVSTGHDTLDARVTTRTDDADLLGKWLSPARVRLIVDLYNSFQPMEVSSVAVTYHSQLPDSIETVVRHGRDLAASTATLLNIAPRAAELEPTEPRPQPKPSQGIFARQPEEGGPAPSQSTATPTPTPGKAERADERPAEAPQPAASGPSPADPLQIIVAAMFDGDRLSFDTDQELGALHGTTVEWEATVRSARAFSADADLGSDRGVKLHATVAKHHDELLGTTLVDAIVGLPEEAEGTLNRNDEVRFSGTISRIDSIMRTIYVTNGRLIVDPSD